MKYIFDSYNYVLRVDKGERLQDCMEQFFEETNVEAAFITGIGSCSTVELGYYNPGTKAFKWKVLNQPLEVLGLWGSISLDENEKPLFHLHGTFSDENFNAIGGHVKDLTVSGTLELFIHRTYEPLKRTRDSEVGLQVLDI